MNWTVIVIAGVVVIAFMVFTTIRNQKDRRELEQKLNNNYPKEKGEAGDIEIE